MAGSLKGGEILALTGKLGSGKTTFVQGLAQGLGIKKRVISPTFILMRRYSTPITNHPPSPGKAGLRRASQSLITNFYHLDLYRLEKNLEKEVENLGIKEIWTKKENVVAIEWSEKIRNLMPKKATWLKFEDRGGDRRMIEVRNQ